LATFNFKKRKIVLFGFIFPRGNFQVHNMKKKECPSCGIEVDAGLNECKYCGYEFPDNKRGFQGVALLLALAFIAYLIYNAIR
jgi:hypothetical protein